MESINEVDDDVNFRVPEQARPLVESSSSNRGGRRIGAGRKRVYKAGYQTIRDLLWKTVSIHTNVFEEWTRERERRGFKNNSDFARFLLDNAKSHQERDTSTTSISEDTRYQQMQRIDSPMSSIGGFCPPSYSTPQGHSVRTKLLHSFSGQSIVEDDNEQTDTSMTKITGSSKSNEIPFLDTIIRDNSLNASELCISENESDNDDESGDDVCYECSDASSSEYDEDDLLLSVKELNISCNEDFISHDTVNVDDYQSNECIDMDITSELELIPIECNIPIMSQEQQNNIDGVIPPVRLISEKYYENMSKDCDDELNLVNENKFVCSVSKIKELFSFCMDRGCNMPLVEVKEKIVGCVLEVRWCCKVGHRGNWQSSEVVNRVYVNNIQAASSLLFTGNNYAKLSLFAKCFHLAFIGETTFHQYQRKYLATPIHSLWSVMQTEMFATLGDQQCVVSGDGQVDSPGYCAKNCTYTIMHAELDYVLHVEVVDVRHSQLKSVVMEKVGCQRALHYLMDHITVAELVTDASSQVIKLLATDPKYKNVAHQLDIWHKSNKLDKKLTEAGKKVGNAVLKEWFAPIRNHFWHCSKDCKDNLKNMKKMWINLLKHVTNQHIWYGGQCSHGPLELGDKEWILPDSRPMQALREIVLDKKLLKSFPFYTRFRHTGKLEAYHSHRLMYAPKRFGFSYEGVVLRSLLAAIDHNHHLHRKQACNKKAEPIYSRRWSKRSKRWKVVFVKEKKNYSYLPILCARVLKAVGTGSSHPISYENHPKNVAPTIAALPAPPTSQLVKEHLSRF